MYIVQVATHYPCCSLSSESKPALWTPHHRQSCASGWLDIIKIYPAYHFLTREDSHISHEDIRVQLCEMCTKTRFLSGIKSQFISCYPNQK